MTNWLQQTQTAFFCALKSSHEFTVSRFEKTGCAAWAFVRSSGIAAWVPRVAAVFPTSFRCFSFCMASAAFPWRLHFYSCGNVKNSEQWIAMTRFGARACCFLVSPWESQISTPFKMKFFETRWLRPPLEERLREDAQQLEVRTELLHLQLFRECGLCFIGYDDTNKSSQIRVSVWQYCKVCQSILYRNWGYVPDVPIFKF